MKPNNLFHPKIGLLGVNFIRVEDYFVSATYSNILFKQDLPRMITIISETNC